ncbi:MAG TPA: tRNA epoxyqueuosine(34) reductase QueG [Tissierellaceae bacterium]|nr:tRNA epoxyqueuosine(34) reductase QueG [Tissierellaceae bacterium]
MINIRDYIRNKSQEIGIDIIGFTDGDPLLNIKDYLIYKRELGKYTTFEEKDIEKRIDPKQTLPNCQSIIVVGISYNVDYNIKDNNIKLKGRLSKSSWGIDYHRVLRNKMEKLVKLLEEDHEFEYKIFTDTGPLVDRELAKKAGIGYYGKNCSIINKEYGSFIFLGYILTSLEIDIEKVYREEECGDCTLCLRACPTGALESKYHINSNKCISYLTQTKEIIPEELRHKMGNRIYGCDTCQEVCPKNKGIKYSKNKEFIPQKTKGIIDIKELLSMSNREFREKYGDMAGSWRGKNTLKRNAIITLGNMKSKENLEFLYEEEKKDIKSLNEYIKWSINKIND